MTPDFKNLLQSNLHDAEEQLKYMQELIIHEQATIVDKHRVLDRIKELETFIADIETQLTTENK